MAHVAALRAHGGELPVGVTVFVEGEEEIGSDSLATILERHGEKLRADAIVLADSTNWAVGEPALTTTLRGMIRVVADRHGPWTTASTAACSAAPCPTPSRPWCALLASLHDADGEVAVAGPEVGRGRRPGVHRGAAARRVRAAGRGADHRHRLAAVAALDQALDHDDRHRRALGGHLLQHAGAVRGRQGLRCASPPTRTRARRSALLEGHLRAHAPWGVAGRRAPRRRGRRVLRRRAGPGLRRGPRRVRRRLGRAAGRHRRRRVDPVRGGVRREVPRRRDPRHRRRGPRHAGPRRQREPAPRRVRAGVRGRGGAAGAARARCRADGAPAGLPPTRVGSPGVLSPCWSRRAGRASGRGPRGPSARPRGRP